MNKRLTMPSLASAVVAKTGEIDPAWAKFLRDVTVHINAERASGRIEPFYLSAVDLADATKFVQSGATAGLGVGEYLGWAICNGNNGTPDLTDVFPRWSTSAAGTTGGSDSSAHTHGRGTLQACIVPSSIANYLYAKTESATSWAATRRHDLLGYAADTTTVNTAIAVQGATDAASASDNRPAFITVVPMMRVTT